MDAKSEFGNIVVENNAIANLIGETVSECYGVVGMTSRNIIKDGFSDLLKRDNYTKGVVVKGKKENLELELYIVVAHGVKCSEVAYELQKKVAYVLDKTLNLTFSSINVFVQGIKVIN